MALPSIAAWLRREAAESQGRPSACRSEDGRICSPEETFARVEPLLPRYGVTRLGRLTGLDRLGIPVWNAVRPNSLTITVSQGKGITDAHAKTSAAMEALERAVAGEPQVALVTTTAAALRAAGRTALTLTPLLGWGATRLGDEEATEWLPGLDLFSTLPVWVPADAVRLDRTRPSRFWQSSDGLASGNTLSEAVLHGLLERIERDAEVLWNLAAPDVRKASCVDPRSFGDERLSALCDGIENADMHLRLFDMTSDIRIPAFTALLAERGIAEGREAFLVEVANGSGAHPSPARAAIRAVTEAAQSRLTYVSGARDDFPPGLFSQALPRATRQDLEATPLPGRDLGLVACFDAPQLLGLALRRLAEAGIRSAVAVPLLGPKSPFSVAKVLATELEHPAGSRKTQFGSRAVRRMLAT